MDSDGTVHYDTNLTVELPIDPGVTAGGANGRYAKFLEIRTHPLVKDTKFYKVGVVRASVTTNGLPLYTAVPSTLVTENGTDKWEVTCQPGMSFTWTGQVFGIDDNGGMKSAFVQSRCSWPYYGAIPYYTQRNAASGASEAGVQQYAGSFDCSYLGASADVTVVNCVARLNSYFQNGQEVVSNYNSTMNVTVASSATTQQFTFTNSGTNTVYLDFSLPSQYAEQYYKSTTNAYNFQGAPSRAAILQACKILGFIPGQVFVIPPTGIAVSAPRQYQLPFRTTMTLYSYKTARWVPEDTTLPIPTASDVQNGRYGASETYFDCSSYQHFVNQCINPAFQRCIWDKYDAELPLNQQCLQRQLTTAAKANCTGLPWNASTQYVKGTGVFYQGRAYAANIDNINNLPSDTSPFWVDIGTSVIQTWSPLVQYKVNDVVLYLSVLGGAFGQQPAPGIVVAWTCIQTNINVPPLVPNGGNWVIAYPTDVAQYQNAIYQTAGPDLSVNYPTIGTAAPFITFSATSNLFTLNLDSYGFGGTQATNADDGYGVVDDVKAFPASTAKLDSNSALNDQARDSWGLTGTLGQAYPSTLAFTTPFRHPYRVFDERCVVEVDDYTHQLFGNWPALRLSYLDPTTKELSSYLRYIPQANTAGLAVPLPLPLQSPTSVTSGYFPYGRTSGNQPYLYTFPQDYPSIGLMWNPVDTIVIVSSDVPVVDAQVSPPNLITDTPANGVFVPTVPPPPAINPNNHPYNINSFQAAPVVSSAATSAQTVGNTLKLLAEFVIRPSIQSIGQEYRTTILYEPNNPLYMNMNGSSKFDTVDYQLFWRRKATQTYVPLILSNGGSINIKFEFVRI
jgi:hypothetical protein